MLNKTIDFPTAPSKASPPSPTKDRLEPVREVLDKEAEYPPLSSLMGNNQVMLLQLPVHLLLLCQHMELREQETKRRRCT